MRVAILTDIHSNLPAFEAVLSAIDETGIERRWCLGDVVGYGAPDDCTRPVSERCELSLVGNHDLAVTGEISTEVFSASAAAAVEWTRANSDDSTIEFLKAHKPEKTDTRSGSTTPLLAIPSGNTSWRSTRRASASRSRPLG